MARIVFNQEAYLFQWQDDNGCTIDRRHIPRREQTELVLQQIKETPERISLLKSFMIINRLPYHQLLKAGLTLHKRHTYCKQTGVEFSYRTDGLIDLYRKGQLYAVAHTTGVIVLFV